MVRLHGECLADQLEGSLDVAELKRGDAAQVRRIGVIRVDLENLPLQLERFARPAGLEQGERSLQGCANVERRATAA